MNPQLYSVTLILTQSKYLPNTKPNMIFNLSQTYDLT